MPHLFSFSVAEQHQTRHVLDKRKREVNKKKKRQPSSLNGHVERAMKHQTRKPNSLSRLGIRMSSYLPLQSVSIPSASGDPTATVPMHVACATISRRLTAVLSNVLRTCIYTHPITDTHGSSFPCYCSICLSAQSQQFAVAFRVTP